MNSQGYVRFTHDLGPNWKEVKSPAGKTQQAPPRNLGETIQKFRISSQDGQRIAVRKLRHRSGQTLVTPHRLTFDKYEEVNILSAMEPIRRTIARALQNTCARASNLGTEPPKSPWFQNKGNHIDSDVCQHHHIKPSSKLLGGMPSRIVFYK
jgi:hypothetical protein